jgi:hypothetical protein
MVLMQFKHTGLLNITVKMGLIISIEVTFGNYIYNPGAPISGVIDIYWKFHPFEWG